MVYVYVNSSVHIFHGRVFFSRRRDCLVLGNVRKPAINARFWFQSIISIFGFHFFHIFLVSSFTFVRNILLFFAKLSTNYFECVYTGCRAYNIFWLIPFETLKSRFECAHENAFNAVVAIAVIVMHTYFTFFSLVVLCHFQFVYIWAILQYQKDPSFIFKNMFYYVFLFCVHTNAHHNTGL